MKAAAAIAAEATIGKPSTSGTQPSSSKKISKTIAPVTSTAEPSTSGTQPARRSMRAKSVPATYEPPNDSDESD